MNRLITNLWLSDDLFYFRGPRSWEQIYVVPITQESYLIQQDNQLETFKRDNENFIENFIKTIIEEYTLES
jgi:hypothetical protein